MKILTLNFLTCAVKACKTQPAAFPLHIRDAELEQTDLDYNPLFLRNILPRLEWPAMVSVCGELGLEAPREPGVQGQAVGEGMDVEGAGVEGQNGGMGSEGKEGRNRGDDEKQVQLEVDEADLQRLHKLLLETQIVSGTLVCGNCGHEYAVREGIANFLLPAHLV
jgi:multifunctional methyltransferase subunit TRM112